MVFVLWSGTPWHLFPKPTYGVAKSTEHGRLTAWAKAGAFTDAHRDLTLSEVEGLNRLGIAGRSDASAAVIDCASCRAVFGGYTPGRTPWTGRRTA